jgi:hypothetical protein
MTKKQMIKEAKAEIAAWNLPNGLVLAILFAFIHRISEGETIEEFLDRCKPPAREDYSI